ncbi:DUF4238 domain-containing protein [Aquabacterium sp.]|uniref:DUF4238 domain-containing protein n=1 Tax=Aquabacterium sp. TaxID=1872578 RepID=UPI003D06E6FA
MTMAIGQHWVPQFYLRTFATSKGGDSLWVTDVKEVYAGGYKRKKDRAHDIALLKHLYSLPRDDGSFHPDRPNDKGWNAGVDEVLQKLEADAGRLWKRLQEDPKVVDLSPGSGARVELAIFLASLHLRNPRMVAVAKYAATVSVIPSLSTPLDREKFHEAVAGTSVDLSPTLAGVQDRTAFLAAQLHLLPGVASTLHQLHWTLQSFGGNRAAGPLVTSDTPLFCVDRTTMHATGMEDPHCMVICPLTSRLLLLATQERVTSLDGSVVDGTPEGATAINQFIVHFAHQEVYSGFELGENFPFLRDAPTAKT